MDVGEVAHDVGGSLALDTQPVVSALWKLSRRAELDLLETPPVWNVRCRVKQINGEESLLAGKFAAGSQITGGE